jgi:penicillin-binding protein 1A
MKSRKRRSLFTKIILGLTIIIALAIGSALGFALAATINIQHSGQLGKYQPALPSQVLDRDGNLITEIFAEEKRDIVTVEEVPKHLVYAIITREDEDFYEHNGFDLKRTLGALWYNITGQYFSGASTITQQVAGRHYADRSELSLRRKLIELWYAFQLERTLTKNQILEMYMNEEYLGHNTYGVEAASQFYFGHSVREITIAEAAILVLQFSSPARYSPINHPNNAKTMQYNLLQQMVENGYVSKEEAERSFRRYWEKYDYTRSNTTTAYFTNTSKAPYFSEYVRMQLEDMLYGSLNINRDGLVIHTTLDLDYQRKARDYMNDGLYKINATYRNNTNKRMEYVNKQFVPIIELLGLSFDIPGIKATEAKKAKAAKDIYLNKLNPTLDLLSMMLNSEEIKHIVNRGYATEEEKSKRTTVEGALVTLENDTGHILSMIGGSDFKTKKFNRAYQATVQPGSAFKPLYYSAAISSEKFTPATLIYDAPVIFWNDDGTPYTPVNYMGEWKGHVTLRYALAKSMNVPSIQVLDGIGFDAAIERASDLLGIDDPAEVEKIFPRKYPLGLGIISVSPMQMAKAFSTFANEGREVTPIAIRYIEDRKGNVILEPEKELRAKQRKQGEDIQILSPQAAYIMVDLLKSVVEFGTLANRRRNVGGFEDMPMAGKTGTTQNWSDAWTVGFSPYITTAVWFGFDVPGNSLGINQTGATAAGPIWARYMKDIHQELPVKEFSKPETGLTEVEVCEVSGKLPTEACTDTREEIFLEGTEPQNLCSICEFEEERDQQLLRKLQKTVLSETVPVEEFEMPDVEDKLLQELEINRELDTTSESSEVTNPLLD